MTETRIRVSEAIDEAAIFARDAWRGAWASMLLVGAGWALIVVADHAAITDADAGLLQRIGLVLLLVHLPLLGALYRLGLGVRRGLGPGGVQLGGAEWRIMAVNAVLAFFFLLACAPIALLSAVLCIGLGRLHSVALGPLGSWTWWSLIAAVFWIALLLWLAYAAGRLSLATPLSVEQRRLRPFSGWTWTEGYGRTIAVAFVLIHGPALAVWLGLQAFGWVEPVDVPMGLHGPWPLIDAIGAGVVAGAVLGVVQAPLSVGLLTFFYDMLAPLEGDADASVDERASAAGPDPLEEPPVVEPEPESEPEPEPEPPFSIVEFFPHTGRFSRISAPWLAEDAVPGPYAYLSGPEPEADPETHAEEPHEPAASGDEDQAYPHSVVEYSPHTGRFSRLFAPWLAHEAEADDAASETHTVEPHRELEPQSHEAPEPEPHAAPDPEPQPAPHAEAAPPEALALDGVNEAGHAKP